MKLWTNESDDMYKLPKLKDTAVKQAEQAFGVAFSKEYIDILNIQNGGSIVYNAFPSEWNDDSIYIDHIMGIGKEHGILENDYYLKEWDMPDGLILISGDGHSWIAFDYRNTKENPPIVYIDNESEQIFKLAPSFHDFLNKLYLDKDISFSEYEEVIVSKEELEEHIQKNDIESIIESIDIMSQDLTIDMSWFSKKLLELSKHSNDDVRTSVASATHYLIQIDELNKNEEIVKELCNNFKADSDSDINYYAEEIEKEIQG
ncbi:SMI1/KNR4 family protein [Bacillus sp. FJAT-52991]|uniref:SMI1/KNR4 family protein n=1 Tax=Bacillus kandeliae TaxID=3129297 RepID=A0ABZ2NBA8_9BACI